jgi:hypothetical protein
MQRMSPLGIGFSERRHKVDWNLGWECWNKIGVKAEEARTFAVQVEQNKQTLSAR